MKARCLNPNNRGYKYYGGRGIKVCKRWLNSFDNFLADMGPRPTGMTLDRIDNNGNYTPKNCRWTTYVEQNNNTRKSQCYVLNGQIYTINQLAEKFKISRLTILSRLRNHHVSLQDAVRSDYYANMLTIDGKTQSIKTWSYEFKINYNIVLQRIRRGISTYDALTREARKYEQKRHS